MIIGSNVEYIESQLPAFYGCDNISTVIFHCTTPPKIKPKGGWALSTIDATLIVPKGYKHIYSIADFWGAFKNIIEMDEDGETAIYKIEIEKEKKEYPLYNLKGECLLTDEETENLPKGIYIKNGKKVIIK